MADVFNVSPIAMHFKARSVSIFLKWNRTRYTKNLWKSFICLPILKRDKSLLKSDEKCIILEGNVSRCSNSEARTKYLFSYSPWYFQYHELALFVLTRRLLLSWYLIRQFKLALHMSLSDPAAILRERSRRSDNLQNDNACNVIHASAEANIPKIRITTYSRNLKNSRMTSFI